MTLALQGADLVAGQGIDAAVAAAKSGLTDGQGLSGFGAVSAAALKYNTGSHVDMKSVSLITGLSLGMETFAGKLTSGVFFEYGNGSYDTTTVSATQPASMATAIPGIWAAAFWGAWIFPTPDPAMFTPKLRAALANCITHTKIPT